MIIIEKPFVSELLIDSIVQNNWKVLENESIKLANIEEGAIDTMHSETAQLCYANEKNPLIYSNSENSISWVLDNLPSSELSRYIKLFKDKVQFRNLLNEAYPEFNYKEYSYEELDKIKLEDLNYPFVIKPSVGFLSLGVHVVKNDTEWRETVNRIKDEMLYAPQMYPESVVNSSKFIIEDYIEGEEFAIDAYYDKQGAPVILNIYQHPFLNSSDVKDRIYLMSTGIMVKYMSKFALLLKQIGDMNNIKCFPFHMELRITPDDKIIPIEINPMRFAGWCTADVAKYAWGINPYEYYMEQKKPNWNDILEKSGRGVYYFSMAEVPNSIPKNKIKSFNYDKFLSNFSNVLELRRINYKEHPLFAVIFGYSEDKNEIKNILELKTKDFVILS